MRYCTMVLAGLALLALAPAGWSGGKANPIVELAKEKVADPKKPFGMVVFLITKEGQGKQLEEAFRPALKETRKEKGCIAYDLNRDGTDANKYYVYERWQSVAALEAHMDTAHIKTLLSKVGDILTGPPEVKFYSVVGE